MVVIKISGKKERCFYFLLLQRIGDEISTFGKLMTGKYQCNIFLCRIATNNSAMTISEASFSGGSYFFILLCASFAANK
jgi:hypothetical protein